jgi:hypothetical protein
MGEWSYSSHPWHYLEVMFSFTLLPFYPQENSPVTHCLEPVRREESCPWRKSNPRHPARSPSLYRLSYSGSMYSKCKMISECLLIHRSQLSSDFSELKETAALYCTSLRVLCRMAVPMVWGSVERSADTNTCILHRQCLSMGRRSETNTKEALERSGL